MTGRTCLLTGGSRRIGLETAHELARLGAKVIVTSRSTIFCLQDAPGASEVIE